MKAYCNKEKILQILDGRPISHISTKMQELGFDIQYKTLLAIVNNKNEPKLSYAFGICKVLNAKIEQVFYYE